MDVNQFRNMYQKILDTIGKSLMKDKYGIDLNFKIDKIDENANYNANVKISADKPIPNTYVNKEHNRVDARKFQSAYGLSYELKNLTKYIPKFKDSISVVLDTDYNWKTLPYGSFNISEHEDDLYLIDSVGLVLHIPSGDTFPVDNDNRVDMDEDPFHLTEITNDDVWDTMTDKEKQDIVNFYTYE